MPIRNGWKPGDHLFQCMRCGFVKYASEIRTQWDGLRVCFSCFETRHPQEFVRGQTDDMTVPFANPPADEPHFLEPNEITKDSY